MKSKKFGFWFLQGSGWLVLIYLIVAQGVTAFGYEFGVAMGTQEPVETITEVGAAFWYGFAVGDLLIYIPLLFLGLIGHLRGTQWGRLVFSAALGITVYWPVVCLAAVVDARDATGWMITDTLPFWIFLPSIAVWGAWGLYFIIKESREIHDKSET